MKSFKKAAEQVRQQQQSYVLRMLAAGKSYKQIAEVLEVSRQRVHQIEKAAKEKQA